MDLGNDLGDGNVDISLVLTVFSKRSVVFIKLSSIFDVIGFRSIAMKT